MKRCLLFLLLFFISLAFSGYLIFTKTANSVSATCVPSCSDYTGTCGGTTYSDWWECNNGNMCCHGSGCPSWVCEDELESICPDPPTSCTYLDMTDVTYNEGNNECSGKCHYSCTFGDHDRYVTKNKTVDLTPPHCCNYCTTDGGDGGGGGGGGGCSDSCSGYQLVDYNNDCVKNSSSCGGSTRYTGGECSVCPLNNNSCSSKYSGNTQTSGDCVIAGCMWSNGDFTVKNNVSFAAGSGATLTAYGKIIMQGGTISLANGYILSPHQ